MIYHCLEIECDETFKTHNALFNHYKVHVYLSDED